MVPQITNRKGELICTDPHFSASTRALVPALRQRDPAFLQEAALQDRIQELKREIALRVRAVMPTIPEDEFEQLIDQMARIQHKYETLADQRAIGNLLDPDARGT